jgi:hypothetical protein
VGDQRGELVLGEVLGGVLPRLVRHPTGRVGDARALLRQLQGGALGIAEHLRLPSGRDQVEALRGLPGVLGVLGVHVGVGAARSTVPAFVGCTDASLLCRQP